MTETQTPAFDRHMLEALVCPQTHTVLEYHADVSRLAGQMGHVGAPEQQPALVDAVDAADGKQCGGLAAA